MDDISESEEDNLNPDELQKDIKGNSATTTRLQKIMPMKLSC